MSSGKIQTTHLARQAIIYPRQSTMKQVHEHQESTIRQYALKSRAITLGWSEHKVTIVDDDMGQSGASAGWRQGFQRMAEDVAHGRVGGIFALEVSRLARSSADWHRLLELCTLADVLIVDEQAIYNPSDYNDRLLLGLKGTMSEAELYWMRLRMEGGKLSKARRGELYFCPPAGYEWDRESRRFRLDPSDEVQRAITLVFDRFRLDGSAYAVTRYLARMGLRLPCRDLATKQLIWALPRPTQVLLILHNPIYTGTYVFGRKEERMGLVDGKLRYRRVRYLKQDEWKSVIHDRHPAYISWEEFMANQKKLEENRSNRFRGENRGAAREGHALLQGIVLCGRCGRRMGVQYQGTFRRVKYYCKLSDFASKRSLCWDVSGTVIDRAVEKLFLEVVIPSNVELAFSVARDAENQVSGIDRQWKLKKERLQYEARLAERRYKAIDPDNRVVARTLEREWEEKLRDLEKAEQEHEEIQRKEKLKLTNEDRGNLISLSKDLRGVWNAQSTTYAERKNMFRILIREITLSPIDLPFRSTRIQVWWQTGAVGEVVVPRKDRYTAVATPAEVVNLVRDLFSKNLADNQIAKELTRRKIPRKVNEKWDIQAIRRIRYSYGFYRQTSRARRAPKRRSDGLYSVHGVAETLGVRPALVINWANTGLLPTADGGGTTRARWFRLDEAIIELLKVAKEKRLAMSGDQKNNKMS